METIEKCITKKTAKTGFRKWLGLALFLMGLFWFAHRMEWIPVHPNGSPYFWPLITMGAGCAVFFARHHASRIDRHH
jgi:hypothetical protein